MPDISGHNALRRWSGNTGTRSWHVRRSRAIYTGDKNDSVEDTYAHHRRKYQQDASRPPRIRRSARVDDEDDAAETASMESWQEKWHSFGRETRSQAVPDVALGPPGPVTPSARPVHTPTPQMTPLDRVDEIASEISTVRT